MAKAVESVPVFSATPQIIFVNKNVHLRNYGTISIAQLGHVLPFQFCDTYMTGTSWKVGNMLLNMIIVACFFFFFVARFAPVSGVPDIIQSIIQ